MRSSSFATIASNPSTAARTEGVSTSPAASSCSIMDMDYKCSSPSPKKLHFWTSPTERLRETMRRTVLSAASGIVLTLLAAGPAPAQVVKLWSGVAPGSEGWTQQEKTYE